MREQLLQLYVDKVPPELLSLLNTSLLLRKDLHKLKDNVESYIPWQGDQVAAWQAYFISANPDTDIRNLLQQLPTISQQEQHQQQVQQQQEDDPKIRDQMEAFYGKKDESGKQEMEQ